MSADVTTEAYALALAERGFYVFSLPPGTKHAKPSVRYAEEATRDPMKIREVWSAEPEANIGVFTGAYGDGEALLVVDIDVPSYWKSAFRQPAANFGYDTIAEHERQGRRFPATFTQHTPSGGRHWIYRVPRAVKQGMGLLGFAVDVWSGDYYVVGVGSFVGGKRYAADFSEGVQPAPQWLVHWCETARPWPTL